jgi:hypothetical protein
MWRLDQRLLARPAHREGGGRCPGAGGHRGHAGLEARATACSSMFSGGAGCGAWVLSHANPQTQAEQDRNAANGWQAYTFRAQSRRSRSRTIVQGARAPVISPVIFKYGLVVELADTADSKSVARKGVGVRLSPRPFNYLAARFRPSTGAILKAADTGRTHAGRPYGAPRFESARQLLSALCPLPQRIRRLTPLPGSEISCRW